MSAKDVSDELVCKAIDICHKRNRETVARNPWKIWGMEPSKPEPWPYDLLAEWTGQPIKVCYRAMERAEERGLIEYGTSLRTGWLTEKGKALLQKSSL